MNFKELRLRAGFSTAKEAARALNISCSMIHKIEIGYRTPGKELIKKMIEVYKCSLEEIFLAIEVTNSDKIKMA